MAVLAKISALCAIVFLDHAESGSSERVEERHYPRIARGKSAAGYKEIGRNPSFAKETNKNFCRT
jgi:hypothetical protein